MSNRNAIFKDITNQLKTKYQIKESQARALAKQALVENRDFGTIGKSNFWLRISLLDGTCI